MNAVQYGLSKIHFNIPDMVLFLAFKDPNPVRDQLVSLDDKIMTRLIRPYILKDMNVIGGVPIKIQLANCVVKWLHSNEYLVTVPKNLTNYQPIISCEEFVSATVAPTFAMNYVNGSHSPLLAASDTMFNNLAPSKIMQTARIELIGENRILISDPSVTPMSGVLRCTIANNGNLENIHAKTFPAVGELFTLGTKAFVYNTLKVPLDQGYIYGGHELPVITEIVDSFSDASEMYHEYLTTTWKKAQFLNSPDNTARYIKLMLSNTI